MCGNRVRKAHIFKEDAVQDRTYLMRLIPIDVHCELLHSNAVYSLSADCCNRHDGGYQAAKGRPKHLSRAAAVSRA